MMVLYSDMLVLIWQVGPCNKGKIYKKNYLLPLMADMTLMLVLVIKGGYIYIIYIYFLMVLYSGILVLIWHIIPCNKGKIYKI